MPSTVEMITATRAKLTIEIPFADLEPSISKVRKELAGQISIPGFRKGHIPAAVIDARLGREYLLSEAINEALPEAYGQAVEFHGLTPLGRPEVELVSFEDGEPAIFHAEVDVVPEFEIPDPSVISVTVDAVDDLDGIVEERIEILRERFAEIIEVDREAREGDQILIDLSASQNGEVLEEAQADQMTYVLGSGQMLEGLDEAVTGCRAGDERTFTSTLVGGNRLGEEAEITVKVTQVLERTLPEINDEFAQLVSAFDTAEEMKEDLAKAVARSAFLAQVDQARNRVLDAMIHMAEFDVPASLIDGEVESRMEQVLEQLKAAGMSVEDYIARIKDPEVSDVDTLRASTQRSVERGVRADILLSRVAEIRKIEVSQQDLTSVILQQAQETGMTPDQVIQHMREHESITELMSQIRASKALDSIVVQAEVKGPEGSVLDLEPVLTPKEEPED